MNIFSNHKKSLRIYILRLNNFIVAGTGLEPDLPDSVCPYFEIQCSRSAPEAAILVFLNNLHELFQAVHLFSWSVNMPFHIRHKAVYFPFVPGFHKCCFCNI